MAAKYFSSCIPVIRETGGGEGRGSRWEDSDYTDSRQIQTSCAHLRLHFLRAVHVPLSEIRAETPVRMMSPHRGMLGQNSTVAPKTTVTCGCIFLTGVIIFRGQTSIIAEHTNNKTVQAFWKHKDLNKRHLKFAVKFTLGPDLPLESRYCFLNQTCHLLGWKSCNKQYMFMANLGHTHIWTLCPHYYRSNCIFSSNVELAFFPMTCHLNPFTLLQITHKHT